LVELLAVVLILSVLAAIAVPLYVNSRKSSAARACTANLASIAAAESAYKTRFGSYVSGANWSTAYVAATAAGDSPTGGLIGAPEGLGAAPTCPRGGGSYTIAESSAGDLTIECANKADHASDTGTAAATWVKTILKGGEDKSNPL
jgi:type IV pilus assembly protein PilA